MCQKKSPGGNFSDTIDNMEEYSDSDSSDVSMTDSESDEVEGNEVSNSENANATVDDTIQEVREEAGTVNAIPRESNSESDLEVTTQEDEEEDETIKAIRRESNRERDHPPSIQCEDFIMNISFHPQNNILAVASVVGDVLLYKYSNEENTLINTLELHSRACRDIEFSQDGKMLFSVSKDKSIMISDTESGKLIKFYDDSHEVALYCLTVIDEQLISTGDDDGTVKVWDIREKGDRPIYKIKKNEGYISDMLTDEHKKFLICASGDGSLTTIDLQNRKVYMLSEEYEEELTCLGLFRNETKLLSGSSKGNLFLYNWEEFGLHSDSFPGPKMAINDLIPVTENIVVTASEDGNLRATHLFPHRHLGIVGQHDLSIENVDICNTGQFIASSSHNNDIKFWNIQYFEDFEKVSQRHKKHNRRNELKNNLPSSTTKNATDFFSDLS